MEDDNMVEVTLYVNMLPYYWEKLKDETGVTIDQGSEQSGVQWSKFRTYVTIIAFHRPDTKTVTKLAQFFGIPERDAMHIVKAEIPRIEGVEYV